MTDLLVALLKVLALFGGLYLLFEVVRFGFGMASLYSILGWHKKPSVWRR